RAADRQRAARARDLDREQRHDVEVAVIEVLAERAWHAMLHAERACGVVERQQTAHDQHRAQPALGVRLLVEGTRELALRELALLDQQLPDAHRRRGMLP